MIREQNGVYTLDTAHTTYCFRVLETGQPEHLYYGRRIHVHPTAMQERRTFAPGNAVTYCADHPELSLEDVCLEVSGCGKGDLREPFVELVFADGSCTTDFMFESSEVTAGKPPFDTLPGSYGTEDEVEHLTVTLRERCHPLRLELHYYVFAHCDVITRSARLINDGTEPVRIERLMSLQLDFDRADLLLTSFHGAWTREMRKVTQPLQAGAYVGGSHTGTSSNRCNPLFLLSEPHTTEDSGLCYGCNLIYSGNHYEAAQVSMMGKLRVLSGIQPRGFCWQLQAGESLEAPEAVLTVSCEGFGGMSRQMHTFVRRHIVRGTWKDKPRPILLNSWEASYFDISERRLLRLAKAAKDVGIELFVMDDGWFAGRNDDTTSLGDWRADTKKLPHGLRGIADKVRALGMDFGIWVEPEMVNVQSDLYRAHPEWVLEIPGQPHAEGRSQRILNLADPAVQDFVIESMSVVFSSADISYVKWDMNRNVSDVFAQSLPAEQQGEAAHRYVCGLYRCMQVLTARFPHILFEGCASGGNRFDLGILCYFPQIWASDNTDAYCRAEIQNNYSYGYPMNTLTAHVSDCPNHQTLRTTPLVTRGNVAAFAVLGYECNLCDMSKAELDEIRMQIAQYKQWREVLQNGTFYRIHAFDEQGTMEWCVVSEDQSRAVGLLMQGMTQANQPAQCFRAKGLEPDREYRFYHVPRSIDIRDFGSLINTAAPVHIRQGSLVQSVAAKVIRMTEEAEDVTLYGDTLMYGGVKLAQPFRSTGYNGQIRLWKDFSSRLYYMEQL